MGKVDAQEWLADVEEGHRRRDVAQPEVPPHHIPEVCAAEAKPQLQARANNSYLIVGSVTGCPDVQHDADPEEGNEHLEFLQGKMTFMLATRDMKPTPKHTIMPKAVHEARCLIHRFHASTVGAGKMLCQPFLQVAASPLW